MTKIRVLCVDDVPEIATLICHAVGQQPDMTCVDSLEDNKGVVEAVLAHQVDIVVLDLTMPGADSLDIIADVARNAAFCRVIAYSGFDDPSIGDAIFEAGGWGLVSKLDSHQVLIDAIRAVKNDQTVFPMRRGGPDVPDP